MTGGGYYEAERVGLDSYANKLTAQVTTYHRPLTPLQREVNVIVRTLLIIVIVFDVLLWVRNTIGGVPFVESIRMSTVIVALIPNGLVLSIALAYALGAVRLLGKGMLIQQANGIESLSNVDVLCTDKTGTLTSNALAVHAVQPFDGAGGGLERLLGTYAASIGDANRTIEGLQRAYRRGAPRGRARGSVLIAAQVERTRVRRARPPRNVCAGRAGSDRAGLV